MKSIENQLNAHNIDFNKYIIHLEIINQTEIYVTE